MIIDGTAVAPDSAQKNRAQLLLCPDGTLKIQQENAFVQENVKHISVADALGNIPRTVTFPNGWSFTPESNVELEAWLTEFRRPPKVHALEGNLIAILVSIVVTLALGWWVVTDGIPKSSVLLANALPMSVNDYIGERAIESIDGHLMKPSELDDTKQARLQAIFATLITNDELRKYTPTLLFRSWSDANAFALADGTVIMTDQMIELTDSDEEIISILLHELGHVEHNHVMEHLVHATFMSVLVAYIIGDVSGVSEILSTVALLGLQSSFSQGAETEADEFAAFALVEKYGHTDAMVSVFEKLQTESDVKMPAWLSSHPDMKERIHHIQHIVNCPVELAKCQSGATPYSH